MLLPSARSGKSRNRKECDGTPYRLLGVGLANLCDADFADPPDLIDIEGTRRSQAERAMDKLRAKFGDDAIIKGRSSLNWTGPVAAIGVLSPTVQTMTGLERKADVKMRSRDQVKMENIDLRRNTAGVNGTTP